MGGVSYEIMVVDNASSDGSADAVRMQFPDVNLIASEKNLGFAAGNNLGLPHARGEYVLFLNPDTIVPAGAVSLLVRFLETHPEVGIVGPRIIGQDNVFQISAFGLKPSLREAVFRAFRIWKVAPFSAWSRRFLVNPDTDSDWTCVEHLLGACMLVRTQLLKYIGGFDESFFLFLEETDLCIRVQKEGYRIAYYIGTTIIHLGEQSMQSILDKSGGLYIRSYNLFCKKYGLGAIELIFINIFLIVAVLIDALVGLVKFRSLKRMCRSFGSLWYGYVCIPVMR
jgi:GT2 family glycosyltransferase